MNAEVSAIHIELDAAEAGTRGVVKDALTGALTGALIGAGPAHRAGLTVALPADARPGAVYTFFIKQRQGTEAVGRLTAQVTVK
ncbi:MAG: hypothetical protein ACUVR4_05310 [Anaerolineae bacterium]